MKAKIDDGRRRIKHRTHRVTHVSTSHFEKKANDAQTIMKNQGRSTRNERKQRVCL
jgi:hypothetical protein